jgi:hypothetical protein
VLWIWHSTKCSLPSAHWQALDKDCFNFLKNSLPSVPRHTLDKEYNFLGTFSNIVKEKKWKYTLPSVCRGTLGEDCFMSSVNACRLIKLTTVSYRWLLTALCGASCYAKSLTLSKGDFAECRPSMSSVSLSVNVVVAKSLISPSTRQWVEFR